MASSPHTVSYWDASALFVLSKAGAVRSLVDLAARKKHQLHTSGWSVTQARANLEERHPERVDDWVAFTGQHFRRVRDQNPDYTLNAPEEMLAPLTTALSIGAERYVTAKASLEAHFKLLPIRGMFVVSPVNYLRDIEKSGMYTQETLRQEPGKIQLTFTVPDLGKKRTERGRKSVK